MGEANCGPELYIKQDEQEAMESIHHSSMVSVAVPAPAPFRDGQLPSYQQARVS